MKWSETSSRDKVSLILDRVLGYYILPDGLVHQGQLKLPHWKNSPLVDFHWPAAFWDESVERWQTRDIATDPVLFDPCRDLNDAWMIVEKLEMVHFSLSKYNTDDDPRFVYNA